MRRLLLVAALVVPAAAFGAIPAPAGKVIDIDNYNSSSGTSYINKGQCEGTVPLNLEWNTTVTGAGGDSYQVYASNTAPSTSGDNANYCPEDAPSDDVFTGPIGEPVDWTSDVQRWLMPGADAARAVTTARKTCTENEVVYLCAHFLSEGTKVGYASGKFTLQVAAPVKPGGVSAWAADADALQVQWTRNSSGVDVERYVVTATPADGVGDVHTKEVLSGNSAILEGLEAKEYVVVVTAYSIGGNPSPGSDEYRASPGEVFDFWENYLDELGRDDGGCGSGGTGPLALLAVGLLALLRRRA